LDSRLSLQQGVYPAGRLPLDQVTARRPMEADLWGSRFLDPMKLGRTPTRPADWLDKGKGKNLSIDNHLLHSAWTTESPPPPPGSIK
ncbi:UNVERIFIED_CONTAM: hypothetical protein Sradi_2345500, partial [Sesamum radiatum]